MKCQSLLIVLMFSFFSTPGVAKGGDSLLVELPKTIYFAGESVRFKVGARLGDSVSPSQIAYAELMDRNGKALAEAIIKLNGELDEAYLDLPENLVSDHYLLRVYTGISPLSSTGVFHQFVTVLNPQEPAQATATADLKDFVPDRVAYGKREKVFIDLPEGNFSHLAITVAPENPFLPTEFSGRLKDRIYQQKPQSQGIPELYGHVVKAKLIGGAVDTTETYFLSAHGRQSALYTAKPNVSGELFFDLGALDQVDYVILQSQNWRERLNVLLESPFKELEFAPGFTFPVLRVDEQYEEFILDLLAAKEVSRYFEVPAKIKAKDIVPGFYADQVFLLDDYNRFEDFATTIREYVPKVRVRRQDKKTVFKVFDDPGNTIFEKNPLILLDAMPVFDSDALARFDPENIKSLQLIYREFYLNSDHFPGVMSLSSFDNDFGGFPIPEQALYIPYSGPQVPRNYHSEIEGQDNSFRPDFRTILLWESNVQTQEPQIEFLTSEVSGPFRINIHYKDEKGREKGMVKRFVVE